MKKSAAPARPSRFQFVLDELEPLRPSVRKMFGFTYAYAGERLVLALRESERQPKFNGVWLYTEAGHIESLRREFPELPRRCFWKSGRNGWVILVSSFEEFEEYAFRACELILSGDRRVGRVTRGSSRGERAAPRRQPEASAASRSSRKRRARSSSE